MLLLSRTVGQRICIGDNVEVEVVEIKEGRVVLGFSAPRDVTINREEIHQRIKAEQEIEGDKS